MLPTELEAIIDTAKKAKELLTEQQREIELGKMITSTYAKEELPENINRLIPRPDSVPKVVVLDIQKSMTIINKHLEKITRLCKLPLITR